MMFFPINKPEFQSYLGQMYPTEIAINATAVATLNVKIILNVKSFTLRDND